MQRKYPKKPFPALKSVEAEVRRRYGQNKAPSIFYYLRYIGLLAVSMVVVLLSLRYRRTSESVSSTDCGGRVNLKTLQKISIRVKVNL
jgi:hypothetical protein